MPCSLHGFADQAAGELMIFRFHTAGEVDFDIDLREIQSQERLNFASDDGAVVRGRQELVGGLPKGAQAGEMLRTRDVGTPGLIYQLDDTERFGQTVDFLGGFTAVFVVGLIVTRPWRFRAWLPKG